AKGWTDSTNSTKETLKEIGKLTKDIAATTLDAVKPDSASASGTVGVGLGGTAEIVVNEDGSSSVSGGIGSNSGAGVAVTANWKFSTIGKNLVDSSPVSSVHKACGGLGVGFCGTITVLDNNDVGSFTFSMGYVAGGFMTNSVVTRIDITEGN
ncbi:hypothetical protein, partial [Alteromonas sp. 14N.309.X.WAT.G.H12]|uniref:hypothetical protein n=1 Tax=Alteromonas sp. 14N.309.X.WAT.G.H12 TaxID=3120824 RepID=UPI002FCEBED7